MNLDRVIIIGTSCSGKTTFADRLAQKLKCTHVQLDALYWQENWQERPNEEFKKLVSEAVSVDRWVVDGNYSRVREIVWPRATMLIWLNYSFHVVMLRAFRRTFRRVFLHENIYADNRESFRQSFMSRDSILLWIVFSYHRRREEYRSIFDENQLPGIEKVEFVKPTDAERFLSSLSEC